MDDVILWILQDEILDPAYRFLVETNFLDVNHEIERTGSILGILSGRSHKKRYSLMEYLVQKGATPNEEVETEGSMPALTVAAGRSDVRMLSLLLDHSAKISGTGALTLAAQRGKLDKVEYLLSRGADVNEMVPLSVHLQDRVSTGSPLRKATQNGHIGVVDMLLKSGADVRLRHSEGRTAAEIAAQKGADANLIAKLSWRGREVSFKLNGFAIGSLATLGIPTWS